MDDVVFDERTLRLASEPPLTKFVRQKFRHLGDLPRKETCRRVADAVSTHRTRAAEECDELVAIRRQIEIGNEFVIEKVVRRIHRVERIAGTAPAIGIVREEDQLRVRLIEERRHVSRQIECRRFTADVVAFFAPGE